MSLIRIPATLRLVRRSFDVVRRLLVDYGLAKSFATLGSVNAMGDPIPWYSYPATEYLRQFDWSRKSVFEFGSGNSSLFWASLAKKVTSVDSDAKWHAYVSSRRPENLRLLLCESRGEYLGALEASQEKFDLIIVDGVWRNACLREIPAYLNDGGVVLLDDSDRNYDAAEGLRRLGYLQVDFSGFAPIISHTKTTSLFVLDGSKLMQSHRAPIPTGGLREIAGPDD